MAICFHGDRTINENEDLLIAKVTTRPFCSKQSSVSELVMYKHVNNYPEPGFDTFEGEGSYLETR